MTDAKTIAIVSYITPIGWVISLVMNQEKKHKLASFHIRQTLLLYLLFFIASYTGPIGGLVGLFTLILWIIGLINAINKEQKPVWLIGGLAQDWFKFL